MSCTHRHTHAVLIYCHTPWRKAGGVVPQAINCFPQTSPITCIVYFLNAYFHKEQHFLHSSELDTHWHLARRLTRCWNLEAIVLTMACQLFFSLYGRVQSQWVGTFSALSTFFFVFFFVSNWQRQPSDGIWKLSIHFFTLLPTTFTSLSVEVRNR